MSIFFLKIYRFFNQHKYIALALLLALTGVFALLALHIHYEEDIAKFLPKNEKTARFLMASSLGRSSVLWVSISPVSRISIRKFLLKTGLSFS